MKRSTSLSASVLLVVFAFMAPGRILADAGSLQGQFKASVNQSLQHVRETQDPVAKREMLQSFLTRMDEGLGKAQQVVSHKDAHGLNTLREKMKADYLNLNGLQGHDRVADADLNHFANYIQQDLEQADYVYISAGALIIILLILLLIVH